VTPDRSRLDRVIADALDERELSYQRPAEGEFLVRLPGEHKLATMCWLVVGQHALLVEAFVLRRPAERREDVYALLLRRNARLYGVAFCLDEAGDVYLAGRVALHAVTAEEIDRLLGCVLSYADETFDVLLEIGFGDAIRREWAWRQSRGESLANLQAFARFADPARPPGSNAAG